MNILRIAVVSLVVFGAVLVTSPASAISSPQVQTNSASYIQSTYATLNGNLYDLGGYNSATVWFQWGTSTNYSNTTYITTQNYSGTFSGQITGLIANQTYHFRAVAQNTAGTTYGQDLQFTAGQFNSPNGSITVNAGSSLYLNPGQSTTLQGYAYDSNGNPVNYSWTCNGGSVSSSTVAQPIYTAPSYNSQNTYSCSLYASNNYGQSNSASTTIYITGGSVLGATSVSTGLTNDLLTDSFFVPLVLLIAGWWLWKSKLIV